MINRPNLFSRAAIFALFVSTCFSLKAEDAQAKLDAAVAEFEELSQKIASEKLPLAKRVNQKRSEAAELRAATETFLLQQSEMQAQLDKTKRREDSFSAQVDFIEALLIDHSVSFESFLLASEDQRYRESIQKIRKDISSSGDLEERLQFVDLSLRRIQDKIRDPHFTGEAIARDGAVVPGQFVSLGPLSFFRSDDGAIAGQAVSETNSLLPVIELIPQLSPAEIQKLAKSQPALLPLDPTLGKAREVDQAQWSLADQIEKGGKVGYLIIAFAAVALAISLVKTIQLYRIRIPDTSEIRSFLDSLEQTRSSDVKGVSSKAHDSAQALLNAVASHYNDALDIIEERLLARLAEAKRSFEKLLPILAIVAATAPLLGLLGTVVGMIKTFALINVYGSGEAKAFSAGISEALVTTEFGLVVAIPALIMHGILKRYAQQQLGELEDFASNLMVAVKQSTSYQAKEDA